MKGFAPLDPLKQLREQEKRDKRAKAAEKKVKEIAGDNPSGKILGKLARFILKQDLKRY